MLQIHRFDPNDVQFADALVSSAVVWFRKEAPRLGAPGSVYLRRVFGTAEVGARGARGDVASRPKVDRYPVKEGFEEVDTAVLSDFFTIKRGLATGNNRYFILSAEEIERRKLPFSAFRPFCRVRVICRKTRFCRTRTETPYWAGACSCSTVIWKKNRSKGNTRRWGRILRKARHRAFRNVISVGTGHPVCAGRPSTGAVRMHLSRPQ